MIPRSARRTSVTILAELLTSKLSKCVIPTSKTLYTALITEALQESEAPCSDLNEHYAVRSLTYISTRSHVALLCITFQSLAVTLCTTRFNFPAWGFKFRQSAFAYRLKIAAGFQLATMPV